MPLTNSYLTTILVHMLWYSGELHLLAPLALLFTHGSHVGSHFTLRFFGGVALQCTLTPCMTCLVMDQCRSQGRGRDSLSRVTPLTNVVLVNSKKPCRNHIYHLQRRHRNISTDIKITIWIIFEVMFNEYQGWIKKTPSQARQNYTAIIPFFVGSNEC